jgi:hypothetical protein
VNRAVILTAVFGVISAAALADPVRTSLARSATPPVRTYFSVEPIRGLRGWHIDRDSSDHIPHGISLDLDGQPVWGTAAIDFEMPDLILAYSYTTRGDQFRMRPDTGQIDIGPVVGHPVTQSQINVTAGTSDAPLDGIGVGCYGSRSGIYLYQKLPDSVRTKINFNNVFQLGTDSTRDRSPDFWVHNVKSGRLPVVIDETDNVTMAYGATVGGSLGHTGTTLGFYGAPPIPRPVITGSRSDGTAVANLLARLQELGLIIDNTTP